ncbi:C40 family peptidase [Flavobacterium sp. DG1-102-2]|uniref:C40 family peptidase n=1 Tax=Flavobacterium sp. DG1-102-2 TaxID=3081663 RepID=UPI00294A51EB|nr:C40 family peptidase [Flavobacterium sp. DG1-102-2]MDV6166798.1 C40 family peptidase [Flavobacterium sp. DG1-102-2]
MFGICNLAIVPLRLEPSDRSEMTTQVLFGEHFKILEHTEKWSRIELAFDGYNGWTDNKQFRLISEADYHILSNSPAIFNGDLIEYLTTPDNQLLSVPIGSSLAFLEHSSINPENFSFEGLKISGVTSKQQLLQTAFMYLNTPYLWGGKTPFGIDCSGFTQMVYKLNGFSLLRDASQQATQGEALSFIEESEPGDLAFFDNEEGRIIHVGIIMEDNHIIHAHGKVRIDRLDHLGIYNIDTKRHSHKLRVIKKII